MSIATAQIHCRRPRVAGGLEQPCTLSDRSDRPSWAFAFAHEWVNGGQADQGKSFVTRLTRPDVVAGVLNVNFCSDPP